MVRVGDRVASTDDGMLTDTPVTVTRLGGAHTSREAAIEEARRIAASSTEDAVVVEEAGGFRVAVVAEIDRTHGVVDASPGTLGIVSGSGASVSVRRTTDATTRFDMVRTLFSRAGLDWSLSSLLRSGITPALAAQMFERLQDAPLSTVGFSQRMVLARLLPEIIARGETLTPLQLLAEVERYENIAVLRPDGNMVRAVTGEYLQEYELHMFAGELRNSGTSGLTAGEWFRFDGNTFFRMDEDLHSVGGPVSEMGTSSGLPIIDPVLDGVEEAIAEVAHGVGELITHPIRTIEGLADLPDAIAQLIRNSPDYFETFDDLPMDQQVREVSRIAALLYSFYGAWEGSAATLSGGASGLTVPVMTLSRTGELAFATATVPAGTVAAVTRFGGATIMMSEMTGEEAERSRAEGARRREPADEMAERVEARRRAVREEYGDAILGDEAAEAAARARSAGRTRGPAPSESPVWRDLERVGRNRCRSGSGSSTRFYEYDRLHGEIEVYDARGRHLGVMDATTGELRTAERVPGRHIDDV